MDTGPVFENRNSIPEFWEEDADVKELMRLSKEREPTPSQDSKESKE
jgi:hypothetical protein